jgi:toxin ParE1/3/4
LIDIWSYIADDSVTNADAFIDKLYEAIEALSRHPGSGRHRDELAPGIQSFPFGRYIIFYRAATNAIEIVVCCTVHETSRTFVKDKSSLS